MTLQDKTAVITGAGRGLGEAMARSLADAGVAVVLVARNLDELEAVGSKIRRRGGQVLIFAADVSREDSVQELRRRVLAEVGSVHVLINNAGTHLRKPLGDITLEEWRRVMDVNLTSVFLMCRAFVPQMKALGYGRIINLSSVTALTAAPARLGYAASKAGVLGLTRALALELASHGITVNSISPGTFLTQMNAPLMQDPEVCRQFLARIPVGRWGLPQEVGALAVYLCSPAAGFVTGADLLIDGGWQAQ